LKIQTIQTAERYGDCNKGNKRNPPRSLFNRFNRKSLNDSSAIWANKILEQINHKRKDTYQEIVKCRYDIKETVKWLEDFYLTC